MRKFRNQKLKTVDITLRTYFGEHNRSDSYLDMQVGYGGTKQTLPFYIC